MPWERSISLQRLRRCSGPDDFSNTPPYDGHVTRCCVVEWLINHAYVEGDTAAMSVAVLGPVKAAPPEFESGVSLECRPPLVRKDRNPIVKTFVNLSFKNGHEVQEFEERAWLYLGSGRQAGQIACGWRTHDDEFRRLKSNLIVPLNLNQKTSRPKPPSDVGDQDIVH
jgi:hypothetical protein